MSAAIQQAAFEAVCAFWRTGLVWRVPLGTILVDRPVTLRASA